jgi:hypothetical protein
MRGDPKIMRIFSGASVIVFVDFSMADLKEQRVCIEFCFLLGKTAAELSQCSERLLKKNL